MVEINKVEEKSEYDVRCLTGMSLEQVEEQFNQAEGEKKLKILEVLMSNVIYREKMENRPKCKWKHSERRITW